MRRLQLAPLLLALLLPYALSAEPPAGLVLPDGWAADPPGLEALVSFARGESDLRAAVVRFLEDEEAIERRYEVRYSPARTARLRELYEGWQASLADVDFSALNHEGQIDALLLRNRLAFELERLRLDEERWAEMAPLIPFFDDLRRLQEERHDRKRVVPRQAATTLDAVAEQVSELTRALLAEAKAAGGVVERPGVSPVVASRAASQVRHVREVMADWNTFYAGYDPLFDFWVAEPWKRLDDAMEDYAAALDEHLVGAVSGETPPTVGDPVLEDGLRAHLQLAMIPYSPEELIAIGERELAWITDRLVEVSRDMGYGDDWKAALEHTKELAPPPGEKPWAIFDIARYSEEFLDELDAVTVPPLAAEVWRLAMQTPERQLVNPFFTGGEETRVSYPHADMKHRDKLMSMRGNTPHFNFATVHHELIPGHHLQGFLTERFNVHRGEMGWNPFWGEGWALYWELQLWDLGFPRNDPDKIGMLFWRAHRAARIIFSLNYQLGRWSPQQAVDFLVERVGHERANAEAEVRRSAHAPPLYQLAYMIGGMQFRALYRELVESGKWTARQFHDAVLQGGPMPVELVRARLTRQSLTPDYRSQWRFAGDRVGR